MRLKYFIISLLLTISVLPQSKSFVVLMGNDGTWSSQMLNSYLAINNHYNFSIEQKALILERLESDYIVTRFGKDGLNKTVCDFFLFFQDSSTDALDGRTITKSDSTLRWDYGNGNVYWQDNLPAQIPDGVITVTSADGFNSVTVFDLYFEDFNYATFDVAYYMPSVTNLVLGGNGFDGVIPPLPNSLTSLSLLENDFTGTLPDLSGLTNLIAIEVYNNYNLTGSISNNIKSNAQTFNYSNTQLSTIDAVDFSRSLKTFNINGCEVADIDTLVRRLAAYYEVGANEPLFNCTIDLRGALNGYLTNGFTNQYYVTLDSVWDAAGLTLTFYANVNPVAFDKAIVTFTFDDVAKSIYTLGLPLFEAQGISGTVYPAVKYTKGTIIPYGEYACDWTELNALEDAGWVVGSHGYNHINMGDNLLSVVLADVQAAIDTHIANGLNRPEHFSYPQGNYADTTQTTIATKFETARLVTSTEDASVSFYQGRESAYNTYQVYSMDGKTSTDLPQIKKYIDYADLHNVGLMFLIHGLATSNPSEYQITTSLMNDIIDYVQTKDIDILTVDELYKRQTNLETRRYLASLTTALSDSQETNVDVLVRMLKDTLAIDSLPQKFTNIYVMANETVVSALNNLVSRNYDADTVAGQPAWTQWQGWNGDGSSALTTGFNPSTNGGTVVTQNSTSLGAYIHTSYSGGGSSFGGYGASNTRGWDIVPDYNASSVVYFTVNANAIPSTDTSAGHTGLWVITRNSATIEGSYYNSTYLDDKTHNSAGLPTADMYLLARNKNGTTGDFTNVKKFAIIFFGAGFNATQVRGITNCFEWYMDEIGQGKIP